MALRIDQLQFRDIRPKAASEILDLNEASKTEEDITERVYRRLGAIVSLTK